MNRVKRLTKLVREFYESHTDSWIPAWTQYLYENHIFFVAELAQEIAREQCVDPEAALAASLLHDIADAVMDRTHPEHMQKSEQIALELLQASGFTDDESRMIVQDIIRLHSCRDGVQPPTMAGQIMTSADAIYHLVSDFYEFAIMQKLKKGETPDSIRSWGLAKIERDFEIKICFDELRERYRNDYERCRSLFIR